MIDQVIVELMKKDLHYGTHESEISQAFMKPIQLKAPLTGRILARLGDVLIFLGNRFKASAQTRLTTEHAQAPTFISMS